MANGTIAFDTLSTSRQIKGGAAISVDTDFIVSGSARSYLAIDQENTQTENIKDSLNVSSVADDGTGKTDITFTSNMSSANYFNSVTAGNSNNRNGMFFSPSTSLQQVEVHSISTNSTDADSTYVCSSVMGDLA